MRMTWDPIFGGSPAGCCSCRKSMYFYLYSKAFMAYFWREPVGLLSAHREYEKLLSVLWFTEYSPTVFSLWGTCEKMVNII